MCSVSFVKTMGSTFSTKSESPPAETTTPKTNSVRSSIRAKQPMPDANELERRFTKVLVSVDQKLLTFDRSSQEGLHVSVVKREPSVQACYVIFGTCKPV
jgi:hypothetical protein